MDSDAKPILVIYATRHGHTERIARYVAEAIESHNLPYALIAARDLPSGFSLGEYEAAVIAASVHAGKHEREMASFVSKYRDDLNRMHTAFVSVSLSQASAQDDTASPERRAKATVDVIKMMEDFFTRTRWRPTLSQPVAGALMYTKYNWLVRTIMKRIATSQGSSTDTSRDYVFTRWADLDAMIANLIDYLSGCGREDLSLKPVEAKET